MHLLSSAPLLASAPGSDNAPGEAVARIARQFFAPSSALNLTSILLIVCAGVVLQVLAYWIAAKVVLGNERATLARAAHLWLLSLLVGLGLAVALVIGMLVAGGSQPPVLLAIAAGGWALLAVLLALLLPAKVFETDLLRSFGILALTAILVLAGQTALDRALGRPTLGRWQAVQRMIFESPESRQRRLRHLLTGDPLGQIESELDRLARPEERKKSFSERQEGLRAVFAALEAQRKRLKADDPAGLADYEAVRQRYEELVKVMRTDYAASLAPR